MRMLLTLGFGFALTATGALAQTTGSIPEGMRAGDGEMLQRLAQENSAFQLAQNDSGRGWDRGPRSWRDRDDEDDQDRDRDRGQGGRGPGGRDFGGRDMMMMRMHQQMMMGAQGGARFRVRRGDTAIDVRCPAQTQMSACIDAIGQVLDKMGASTTSGTGTTTSPTPTTPPR